MFQIFCVLVSFFDSFYRTNYLVLKGERLHKKRLDAFLKTRDPKVEFELPDNQPRFDMKGIEFTFSFNSGIQWKAWSEVSSSRSSTPPIKGVIEVVKAPPTGQRRIVRRSGFTIRKLPKSKDQTDFRPAFAQEKTPKLKSKTRKTSTKGDSPAIKSMQTSTNLTYATSVS